jgi:hypothetical protein
MGSRRAKKQKRVNPSIPGGRDEVWKWSRRPEIQREIEEEAKRLAGDSDGHSKDTDTPETGQP